MSQYALLVVGIMIGGIAVAGLWGILGLVKTRALRRATDRREQIISSVEEKWVDVDDLVGSYRSGRLSPAAFREAVDGKIESVNRIYKPCIHQLDIFFVKYTEKMIEEYRRLTEPGEVTRAMPAVTPAAHFAPLPAAPVAEPAADIPVAMPPAPVETPEPDSGIAFPAQDEDAGISEAVEAAAADNNLQLESFLEMEPGSYDAGSVTPVEEPEEIHKPAETGVPHGDTAVLSQAAVFEPEAQSRYEEKVPLPPPPAEDSGAVPPQEPGPDAKSSFDEESFLPPPPADIDLAGADISEAETIVQAPGNRFSFSGRVTSEQDVEPVSPPPQDMPTDMPTDMPPPPVHLPPRSQPFSLPSRVPGGHKIHAAPHPPGFTREEVTQPATIFDVEAETIIVDRSTIMGTQRPAPEQRQESDKKNIGITGEDVSDTFDKFFGLGK